jgi:hypothetical protein
LSGEDVGQGSALELVAADVADLEGRVFVRQSQVLKKINDFIIERDSLFLYF